MSTPIWDPSNTSETYTLLMDMIGHSTSLHRHVEEEGFVFSGECCRALSEDRVHVY